MSKLRVLIATLLAACSLGAQAELTLLTDPSQMTTEFVNHFESGETDLGPVTFTRFWKIGSADDYAGGITPSPSQGLVGSLLSGISGTFASGYTAVGMVFGNDCCLPSTFDAVLYAYNGTDLLGSVHLPANMNTQADQFIGLASTVPFNSVLLTGYNVVYMDDFQVGSPVPEPQAYALMLAGLGVLGLAARRRKE